MGDIKSWNAGNLPYTSCYQGDVTDIESDTVNLDQPARGILISVAGTVKITTMDGQDVALVATSLTVGVIYPIAVKRLWVTGTAATGIFLFN